jgi:hypothetical protein
MGTSEPAPEITAVNACRSGACRDRLRAVLGEVQKANQAVRALMDAMETDRASATRHILHLKALRKYQLEIKANALTQLDVENLYDEARVIENPDVEMDDEKPSAGQCTLTSQSLSFTGFSDSDPDYIPSA